MSEASPAIHGTNIRAALRQHGWLSAHVYYRGTTYGDSCDRVILEVIEPLLRLCFARRLISRAFYIRYADYGPHVRLRMWAEIERSEPDLKALVEQEVETSLGSELRARPNVPRDATGYERSRCEYLLWIPYEPEMDRYGGPAGVRVAEDFFCRSSEVAIAALRRLSPGDRPARLGIALVANVVLAGVFAETPAAAAKLMRTHRDYWMRALMVNNVEHWAELEDRYSRQASMLEHQVYAVWELVQRGYGLPDPLDRYLDAALKLREDLRRVASEGRVVAGGVPIPWVDIPVRLVPSYAHMMSNRLGVSPAEEIYIAHLISRTLAAWPEAGPP